MEVLLDKDLSNKSLHNQEKELLVPPKYHCDLVGEGMDYVWALMKKFYPRKGPRREKCEKGFEKSVREVCGK